MKTLVKKAKGLFLSGIVLSLAACAHYQQPAYYPAAASYPVYSGGAVITQKSYYGAYPYSYSPAPYPVYGNYYHDHNDHHDHNPVYYSDRPWYKGRLKTDPPARHPHHPVKNFPQRGKKEPVNEYPDRTRHPDRKARDKPYSYHPQDRRNHDQKDYAQNRKSYDRQEKNRWPNQNQRERNQSNENRQRFNKQQDNGGQTVHYDPKNQRDYRRKNGQQRSVHDQND
ncbi:MAG: hypothetical protein ACXWTP_07930 [Methylosarcina sp.]